MITATKPWEELTEYRCQCGEMHRKCDPCPYGSPETEPVPLGVKGKYLFDGHVATITVDGKHCTCKARGLCAHVRLLLPAWTQRKAELGRQYANSWGPTMYRRLGLNPAEFGVV